MSYLASQVAYWVGQANDTSTGRHPPGWVNAQRWSVTAAQWMADRDAWNANANTAYDSGTWGVGTHWHTRYDQKEAERATWEARANSAWGPSRVWNSGESWEAAYNRVLPPGTTVHIAGQVAYGTQASDGWATNWQLSLTADRAGQWLVVGRASRSTYNSGVQLNVGSSAPGGSLGAFHGLDQGQANTSNGLAGDWWVGQLAAGQVVQAKAYMATLFSGGTLYMDMYFLSTSGYPH